MTWFKKANVEEPISGFHGDYRWLSNFWPAKVRLDDSDYHSVEHAYQAAKTHNPERRRIFQSFPPERAGKAKREGKKIESEPHNFRPDWHDQKLAVMEDLIRQKFTNHPELRQKLLNTSNREIREENSWGDLFWGVSKGIGENNLGKILMKIRKELRRQD
jgi:ribA/ribD-fused uncharacterized protein